MWRIKVRRELSNHRVSFVVICTWQICSQWLCHVQVMPTEQEEEMLTQVSWMFSMGTSEVYSTWRILFLFVSLINPGKYKNYPGYLSLINLYCHSLSLENYLSFSFKKFLKVIFLLIYLYECFAYTYVYTSQVHLVPLEVRMKYPGIGVTDSCRLLCKCWESNSGPLKSKCQANSSAVPLSFFSFLIVYENAFKVSFC